jgi:hypothetical protein
MKSAAFARLLLLAGILYTSAGSFAQSISGIVNSYYRVTGVNVVPNSVTVSSGAGLSPGVKVLIIQMKGAAINQTNSSSFGNINAIGSAGNYEFNYVCGVAGNNILLQYELMQTYDPNGYVQLITVPTYNSVTIADTVRAAPWDAASGTGGIVAIEATSTIFLNSAIDVSGRGFAGGAIMSYPTPTYDCIWTTDIINYFLSVPPSPSLYYTGGPKGEGIAHFMTNGEYGRGKQANGGGGGNNHNAGGAGGGNYGAGGNGGRRSNEGTFNCHGANPGVGGLGLSTYGYSLANNKIFMGGGGGTGHMNNNRGTPGGNGGGIIILTANTITAGGGKLMSNGNRPFWALNYDDYTAEGDGAGGGGAGGTIIINANTISGAITAEAIGAAGSGSSLFQPTPVNDCTGPGGGGAGGVVWIRPAAAGTLTTNVAGGANGTVSMLSNIAACRGLANGATAGAAGATLFNYQAPVASDFVCAPLASANLVEFNGVVLDEMNRFSWKVREPGTVLRYLLQRSLDQVEYETVSTVNSSNLQMHIADDKHPSETVAYYRLKIEYQGGDSEYSRIIMLRREVTQAFEWISLHPNPAQSYVDVSLMAAEQALATITIRNPAGQLLVSQQRLLRKGYTSLRLPLASLRAGLYYVTVDVNGTKQIRKLVK